MGSEGRERGKHANYGEGVSEIGEVIRGGEM